MNATMSVPIGGAHTTRAPDWLERARSAPLAIVAAVALMASMFLAGTAHTANQVSAGEQVTLVTMTEPTTEVVTGITASMQSTAQDVGITTAFTETSGFIQAIVGHETVTGLSFGVIQTDSTMTVILANSLAAMLFVGVVLALGFAMMHTLSRFRRRQLGTNQQMTAQVLHIDTGPGLGAFETTSAMMKTVTDDGGGGCGLQLHTVQTDQFDDESPGAAGVTKELVAA